MTEQKTLNMTPKRIETLREIAKRNEKYKRGHFWQEKTMKLFADHDLVENRGEWTPSGKGGWWITGNGEKLLADLEART